MKSKKLLILETIATFGCISSSQLMKAFPDMKPNTLYHWLRAFKRKGYIERVSHPRRDLLAYQMTLQGYKEVYGFEDRRVPAQRPVDLAHSIYLAEALMTLSRYNSVKEFSRENEIPSDKLKKFITGRRPDAILRLENIKNSYEVALEIESSIKNNNLIDEILNSYEMTFNGKKECRGVIIVTTSQDIFNVYTKRIGLRTPELEKRILLISINDLDKLNPAVYGKLEPDIKIPLKFDSTWLNTPEGAQVNDYQ
jgi:DNA-binding PadR family transcriptional regulator